MADKLNDQEINLALKKIRNKYDIIIRDFKKSFSLVDAFNERYRQALKNRMNITTFIIAEKEAVDLFFEREKDKKELIEKAKLEKGSVKQEDKKTIADKIFEENRLKIQKYQRIHISGDADEEIEFLFGAVREFVNNYMNTITIIFRDKRHTPEGQIIFEYSNKFLSLFDYKGDLPISKKYINALKILPRDYKKIDYEHRYIVKEIAFILNDLNMALDQIVSKEAIPFETQKMSLINENNKTFINNFTGCTYKEAFIKTHGFLKSMIHDFRFKDIKRK